MTRSPPGPRSVRSTRGDIHSPSATEENVSAIIATDVPQESAAEGATQVKREVVHDPPAAARGTTTASDATSATGLGEPAAQSHRAAETAAAAERSVAAPQPRLRIFIIDTGWNSVAGKVLRENLSLFNDLTRDDPTYVVDRETSIKLVRRHQALIGRDPIISVHNLNALAKGRGEVHGFRAHLGLLRDEEAILSALQLFAGFLSKFRHSEDFEGAVRRALRLEGLAGAVDIVMGDAAHKELLAN
ncbi:MAG TPA: hypothetical protein VEK55_17165 [Xanthobacteraceae bacterium]|nr:hypothetical protein [Xanthobacteraceae bacterium]